MRLTEGVNEQRYWDALRPLVAGRRVICVGDVAAIFTLTVAQLRRLGAAEILVVTFGAGAGPQPDGATIAVFPTAERPATTMEAIRLSQAAMAAPSQDVLDTIDRFDPDRSALLVSDFLNTVETLGDRPFLAYRRPEWLALEDKTVIDAFWDRVGVTRAASEVCLVNAPALAVASERLDRGHGVVWSGDAREGFNGGGEYVRWIRPGDVGHSDAANALSFFSPRCDRVRVMPFLEGVPCSVHGIVFDDHVAVLRPVEMVVLRRSGASARGAFVYAGCATWFDPPVAVREEMRALARRVGVALRSEVGFRGAFTVDGVATADGFLPTELNPRMGAGLSVVLRGLPDLPIQLLLDAIVGGVAMDIDPVALESELLDASDRVRGGGTWMSIPNATVPESSRGVTFVDEAWLWSDTEGSGVVSAEVTLGQNAIGAFVRARFSTTTPIGPPVGPLAASFWAFIDAEFSLGIGHLTAAPEN